jgi:two-component system response regulator ChvI
MTIVQEQPSSAAPSSAPWLSANENEPPIRLLLVDDDDDFREAVGGELADYGFEVTNFADGGPMLDYFERGDSADVIILDWNLPTISGIDLLPMLRRQGVKIPVIILTALSGIAYEIDALNRGALDFIDKTRGVPVLAKRARLLADAAKLPADMPVDDSVEHGALLLKPRLSRAFWRGSALA